MSAIEYAVTNPATGETLKTYDTISDDALKAAIGRAHDAQHGWGRDTSVEERAKVIARVAELHTERRAGARARSSRARWASRSSRPLGEVEFSAAIYQYYADNAAKLLADEPIELLEGEGSAFIRRSSVGLLLGIMPWNYPYYQVARFAGPNLVIGNTILLKHAPQCPESAAAMEQIFHDAGVPAGRLHQHLRDQRADRVGHRRPARAGRVADRLGPRGRGGGRDRRPPPQEGRARARRLGPVHRARRRRPRRGRRAGGRRAAGEHRPGVQRRQALHRRSTSSTTPFVEKFTAALTEVEPGDPTSSDTAIGPLSSTGGGGPARGAGQAGDRRRRDARRRRRPRGQLLQDRRA